MLKALLASIVLASSLLACEARAPQVTVLPAQEAIKPGAMTVTGSATLEVSPDCADLTMTITADDPRPGSATRGLQAKKAALIAGLAKLGIASPDVKLSLMTMNPIYEPNLEGWAQLRVRTYRAEMTVTATTHKFEQLGDLMDAGANAGVTQMSSAFRRSDLPVLKKQVRDMALAAARAKAKQTADALGIQLGRILTVAEATNGTMWGNAYFPQVSNEVRTASTPSASIGGTLQPLTLDITVGYELSTST